MLVTGKITVSLAESNDMAAYTSGIMTSVSQPRADYLPTETSSNPAFKG